MEEVGGQVVSESDLKLDVLPEEGELVLERVSFQYEGGKRPWVFQEFHARIPKRKVTVIVGPSGSGKSTLLNLLLNFMQPQEGIVKFGGVKLTDLDHAAWLARCGVVPQDGHLFQGSIAQNIALGSDVIDQNHLLEAALLANLLPMLEHLPHGFQTVIGEGGTGLSKGQRQSVLIARAIYQNPAILFLDEATNDLDPESEELVLERIVQAFQHRTVVIFSSRPQLPVRFDHVITLGNLVRR
jgi:ATP-binding cassette subfamily B protein